MKHNGAADAPRRFRNLSVPSVGSFAMKPIEEYERLEPATDFQYPPSGRSR